MRRPEGETWLKEWKLFGEYDEDIGESNISSYCEYQRFDNLPEYIAFVCSFARCQMSARLANQFYIETLWLLSACIYRTGYT